MMVGFGVGVGVGAGCGTVRFDDILSPLILKLVISLRRWNKSYIYLLCRSKIDNIIPTGPLQCCELLVWEVVLMRKEVNNEDLDALRNPEANGAKLQNLGRSESEPERRD
jgi:hypothetical protein